MVVQLNSFEVELPVPILVTQEGGAETCRAVFIRAPAIVGVGSSVEVLAEYPLSPNQTVDAPEEVMLLFTLISLFYLHLKIYNIWMFTSGLAQYAANNYLYVSLFRAFVNAFCNGSSTVVMCFNRRAVARIRSLWR